MIFGAGVLAVLVLAVLVLACAGATWIVDDDGGADRMGMQIVGAAA